MDNPKKLAYLTKKGFLKPVENSEPVVQNMHDVVQNMHYDKTGVRSAKFAHIDIEEKENKVKSEQKPNGKDTQIQPPGSSSAGRLNLRRDEFESDDDYEKEFYRRNTFCLSA